MTLPFIRRIAAAILTVAGAQAGNVASPIAGRTTATPIEHLIVVVGENLSFDKLFATYEPDAGQTVGNLLSRGIVDKDGTPGPHFADAAQREVKVRDRYSVTPAAGAAFSVLPRPGTTYANALPQYALDTRFPADLPNGPFRITRYVTVCRHGRRSGARFFPDMAADTWVALTSGEGTRQRDDPASSTNQGGVAMASTA